MRRGRVRRREVRRGPLRRGPMRRPLRRGAMRRLRNWVVGRGHRLQLQLLPYVGLLQRLLTRRGQHVPIMLTGEHNRKL
jgi:hypothetical protein